MSRFLGHSRKTFAPSLLLAAILLSSCSASNEREQGLENSRGVAQESPKSSDSFEDGFDILLSLIEAADSESVFYRDAIYGYENTFWKIAIQFQDDGGNLADYFAAAGPDLVNYLRDANGVWNSKSVVRDLKVAPFTNFDNRSLLENIREVAVDHYEAWTDTGRTFEDAALDWLASWSRPGVIGLVYATVERARAPYEDRIESTWRELCDLLVSSQPQSDPKLQIENRIASLCSQ